MLRGDPPEDYDDDGPFTDRHITQFEVMLKRDIATQLIRIQYNRAKGDNPNAHARRKLIERARMLRTFLKQTEASESRDRVWDSDYTDNVYSRIEFEGLETVQSIVESLHRTGSKPEVEQ